MECWRCGRSVKSDDELAICRKCDKEIHDLQGNFNALHPDETVEEFLSHEDHAN